MDGTGCLPASLAELAVGTILRSASMIRPMNGTTDSLHCAGIFAVATAVSLMAAAQPKRLDERDKITAGGCDQRIKPTGLTYSTSSALRIGDAPLDSEV